MLESLARRAGVASREEKWLYERLFPPREGQSVLDVGASRWTDLPRRTPSRWFPIESQSRLPLLHWLPLPLTWRLAR
jgi:hypothetical protein